MRILLTTGLLLFSGCTNFFYQPTRVTYFEPTEKVGALPEEISFASLDGKKLHGWFFRAKEPLPAKGTVIQFHGNAENLTSHFLSLAWVVNYGYNFFTFDYRGYGKSEGDPYPAGVHKDSLAALEKVRELLGGAPKSVIVYGQSLGGAIALRAVEDLPDRSMLRALVIEASYLSYKKVASDTLERSWLTWPFQWMAYLLVSNSYSPKEKFKELAGIPILVLHATKDPVVPFRNGKELFKAAPEPKCFWPIELRNHAHLMSAEGGKYRRPMVDFFQSLQCPKTPDAIGEKEGS